MYIKSHARCAFAVCILTSFALAGCSNPTVAQGGDFVSNERIGYEDTSHATAPMNINPYSPHILGGIY